MASSEMRQRQMDNQPQSNLGHEIKPHPGGKVRHGSVVQAIRLVLLISYFCLACLVIVATQIIGAPLYWINRNYYYAYMALTKQSFGIFVTTLTQWWAPTVIRISGDNSIAGQFQKTEDGKLKTFFPKRLVLIANHQLYSDWLYLWWAAYTNQPKMHGHIFIILKESLKHIPLIGWGMRFYGFIFMSRKLVTDEPRMTYRLRKLKEIHSLSGEMEMDPMWLLLFPEGTNASIDGRIRSRAWAEKQGIKDMEHTLLPRSSGSFFCLCELKGTVDYVYDCTIVYEGVKRGEFGQDNYTLRTMYLLGQSPPSVNMYWRRFALSDIPLEDKEEFDQWLRSKWLEKDALIDHYITEGRFPPITDHGEESSNHIKGDDFIETEVRTNHFWEVSYIFLPLFIFVLASYLFVGVWKTGYLSNLMVYGRETEFSYA